MEFSKILIQLSIYYLIFVALCAGLTSFNQMQWFTNETLPFGVVKTKDMHRVVCGYHDRMLDIHTLVRDYPSLHINPSICLESSLNSLICHGNDQVFDLWLLLKELTSSENHEKYVLNKQGTLVMPLNISGYTDFYASEYHASNVGTLFRDKNNALMPNWKHLPIGYHGRVSSIILSGETVKRPSGQFRKEDGIVFGKSQKMDFELELAAIIGKSNPIGEPIPVHKAEDHIFGYTLMNDWSARDIQAWEYQPLGPFLGKNFGTSISPWIVPAIALEPFKTTPLNQNPVPLPYLQFNDDFIYDIPMEVHLKTNNETVKITQTNSKYLYWSFNQMVAHHTVNGCNLQTGDLLGSGTISGPEDHQKACMLEITENGQTPLMIKSDERRFLHDSDTIILLAEANLKGRKVTFGEVQNTIVK